MDPERHCVEFAACAVRGSRADAPEGLDDVALCTWGIAAGVRLHRFKRTMPLPRVERVLGALAQLQPATLLDVGSGRGTFLWPLLDRFGGLPVTAVESDRERARQLSAVATGGLTRLEVVEADVGSLAAVVGPERRWDVATALEVLEHVDDPEPVAAAVMSAAARAVVASVPATPDDNPGHVRLFTQDSLQELLLGAGATRVSISQVPNHLIAVATRMARP